MLKISDILKKNKKKQAAVLSKAKAKTTANELGKGNPEVKKTVLEIKPKTHRKKEKKSSSESVPLSKTNNDEAVKIYQETISIAEQMENLSADNWENFQLKALKSIDGFIKILQDDENTLVSLFFSDYASLNAYLYQHSVNVSILTIYIARFLKYGQDELRQIGLAALLHDIGLIQFNSLISRNKRFDAEEYNEVKKHPLAGREMLESVSSNINTLILDVVSQEHERLDGSGYPNALESDSMTEAAKLIGLIDAYESMMHIRPYREKYKSEEVIKWFIEHKSQFEYKLLKTLIDLIGIFPLSTAVKLNTKEIGVIVGQNLRMPLKPLVRITHSVQGQILDKPKEVDLASNFSIYIQECLMSYNSKDENNNE